MDVLIQIISQKVEGFAFSWAFERMGAVGRVAEPSQPPALGQGQKGSLGTGSPQEPPPVKLLCHGGEGGLCHLTQGSSGAKEVAFATLCLVSGGILFRTASPGSRALRPPPCLACSRG